MAKRWWFAGLFVAGVLTMAPAGQAAARLVDAAGPARGGVTGEAQPGDDVPVPVFEMRRDLASRLNLRVEQARVIGVEGVTWADGCLGVHEPGMVCSQALTAGFRATLAVDGLPWVFAYHGSGRRFVAAGFVVNALVSLPFEVR